MRSLMVVVAALLPFQETPDRKIGDVQAHVPVGTRVFVHCSPKMDQAITSYITKGKETFRVEKDVEIARPIKWIGWKLPEGQSVILAAADGDRRALFVGGVEQRGAGDVRDADLLGGGTRLVTVTLTTQGMVLMDGDRKVGPFEEIRLYGEFAGAPLFVAKRNGAEHLNVAGKEHAMRGRLLKLHPSPDGKRLAWVEKIGEKRERAVVDGAGGIECDSVHAGIHFSPNGRHVAYVTREGERYRGWIDGGEVRSEHSVVAARAFSDGTPAWVEMWKEAVKEPKEGMPKEAYRGRIVVKGKAEERVLARPVFNLDFTGETLHGAARTGEESVLVVIEASGKVGYEEVPGRVGRILRAGDRRMFTINASEGVFVQIDGDRRGPYDTCEMFHLKHGSKFGYVSARNNRVQVVVEGKSTPLPLTDFVELKLVDFEMTAAVVGIQAKGDQREIWIRSVPLE